MTKIPLGLLDIGTVKPNQHPVLNVTLWRPTRASTKVAVAIQQIAGIFSLILRNHVHATN